LPAGVQHRVVAVDASVGFQGPNSSPQLRLLGNVLDLPPHHCFLEVNSDIISATGWSFDTTLGTTGGIRFNGYGLTVVNAISTQGLIVNLMAVPRLTSIVPGMTLRSSITTETGAPSQAACYVDINLGTILAGQFSQGGFYTTWTVQTDGDPVLQTIGSNGATQEVPIPSTPIPVPTLSDGVPGSIVLHNSTTNLTDGRFDFALYFLAGTNGIPNPLPTNLPVPSEETPATDETPSCSNSQYP